MPIELVVDGVYILSLLRKWFGLFLIAFYAFIYIVKVLLYSFFKLGEWIQKSTKRNIDGLFEFAPTRFSKIIICQRISKSRVFMKTQSFKDISQFKNFQKDREFSLDKLTYSKIILCWIKGDKYE